MSAMTRTQRRQWRELCPRCGLDLRLDADDIEILVSALGCGQDDEHPAEIEAAYLAGLCEQQHSRVIACASV